MSTDNTTKLKKVLQTVQLDENTSVVQEALIPVKKRKGKNTFSPEQRAKSLATRQKNSAQQREEAVALYNKYNCHVGRTCKKLGISRFTFNSWLEKHPDFKQSIDEAKESLIDDAEDSLHRQIALGSEQSTKFFLTTIGKNRGYTQEPLVDNKVAIVVQWQTEETK